MKTATLSFGANVSGDNLQQGNLAPTVIVLANTPLEEYVTTLASGLTLFMIPQLPTPARYVRITPPSASSVSKWFMAAAGDAVGLQISEALETWCSLSTAITSFNIRASVSEQIQVTFY